MATKKKGETEARWRVSQNPAKKELVNPKSYDSDLND
jgi:hypothetical protein